MLLLNILGFIFLVIIILLVLIILVPFSYMIKSDSIENEVEIFIIWMFGLLGLSYIKKFSKEDEVYLRIFNIPKKIKISDNKVEKLEKVKKDKNSEKKEIDLKKHFNRKVLNKIISSLKIVPLINPPNSSNNAFGYAAHTLEQKNVFIPSLSISSAVFTSLVVG